MVQVTSSAVLQLLLIYLTNTNGLNELLQLYFKSGSTVGDGRTSLFMLVMVIITGCAAFRLSRGI